MLQLPRADGNSMPVPRPLSNAAVGGWIHLLKEIAIVWLRAHAVSVQHAAYAWSGAMRAWSPSDRSRAAPLPSLRSAGRWAAWANAAERTLEAAAGLAAARLAAFSVAPILPRNDRLADGPRPAPEGERCAAAR